MQNFRAMIRGKSLKIRDRSRKTGQLGLYALTGTSTAIGVTDLRTKCIENEIRSIVLFFQLREFETKIAKTSLPPW